MPNPHLGWRLYSRTVDLTPRVEKIEYFFSKASPANGEPVDPPVGYRVAISAKTGLPFLERLATFVD